MKRTLLVVLSASFFSCNTSSKEVAITSDTVSVNGDSLPPVQPALASGCYRMIIEKDTALMKIVVNGNQVSGDLQYNPFEKDGSFGKFTGELINSEIHGWYNYESEGMTSYREVAFKIKGDGLVEGYGDIDGSNDSAWFKYPQALNFENDHPFEKIDCK